MTKTTILIVEDDRDILSINADHLQDEGYSILEADTIQKAYDAVIQYNPSLIILDIRLPNGSGIEFCKEIRSMTSVPIIFLTCLDEEEDKIKGLMSGGDDYMTKPYGLGELTARIHTQLRRMELNDKQVYEYPPLKINAAAQRVFLNGIDALLSPKEYQILLMLVKNIGRTISAKHLYETLWGDDPYAGIKTIQVHISTIRKKLNMDYDTPNQIKSIRNAGYCFRHFTEEPYDW